MRFPENFPIHIVVPVTGCSAYQPDYLAINLSMQFPTGLVGEFSPCSPFFAISYPVLLACLEDSNSDIDLYNYAVRHLRHLKPHFHSYSPYHTGILVGKKHARALSIRS